VRLEQGEDFDALARAFSDDEATRQRGGRLGRFAEGAMVPAFDRAVFAMREPGSLSGPIETRFGFHIIKLIEYFPAENPTFEEIKSSLEQEAKSSLLSDIRQAKLIEARSSPPVEYDEALLEYVQGILRECPDKLDCGDEAATQ
jgi:parvulin-like peptidyl-prolyl isomerase